MKNWNRENRGIHRISLGLAVLLLGCLTVATGCDKRATAEDPELLKLRSQYLTSEAPQGVTAIKEARKSVGDGKDMVVAGRIGAGDHNPWGKEVAMFIVSDASAELDGTHAHGPGHDAENCPFCKRNKSAAENLATIQLVDENGKVVPIDARKLLGVTEDQLVIVQGRGTTDRLGTLTISTRQIYIKP